MHLCRITKNQILTLFLCFSVRLFGLIASAVFTQNSTYVPNTTDADELNITELDFEQNLDSFNFTDRDENSTDFNPLLNITSDDDSTTNKPSVESSEKITSDALNLDANICNCDIIANTCEVNCCCDQDCDEEDLKVFTKCLPQGLSLDKYCYQEDIFYKNNTVYKGVIEGNSNLFCIVRDNLRKKMQYRDIPLYTKLEEFDKLTLSEKFSWNLSSDNEFIVSSNIQKAGHALYISLTGSTQHKVIPWNLPSQCFSAVCDCSKPVYYMEDVASSCTHIIQDLENQCKNSHAFSVESYSNFCFEDFPGATELPHEPESLPTLNVTDETTTYSDAQGFSTPNIICISSTEEPKPLFDAESKECQHIVSRVIYDVWHDGANGIQDVSANYEFLSINAKAHTFTQQFAVNFKWSKNKSESEIGMKRSGNPGYRSRFPLIAGFKTSGGKQGSNKPSVMRLATGLTILSSDARGFCSDTRKAIKFGQNARTGCLMRITHTSCKVLQDNIFDVLLGSYNQTLFVSAFGNPSVSTVDNWVEVFHDGKINAQHENKENADVCDLMLEMEIKIAYAAVGSFINPQYKIVGVVYKYGSAQPIKLPSVSDDLLNFNFVSISTSVNFFDVSESATSAFKKVPVLSAKLPHDFFYPFLLSAGLRCTCTHFIHFFIILAFKLTLYDLPL